jgi:hypothetical protein
MRTVKPRFLKFYKDRLDAPEMMFHYCFEILCQYVEKELKNSKKETIVELKQRYLDLKTQWEKERPNEEWAGEDELIAIELYDWYLEDYLCVCLGFEKYIWLEGFVGDDFPNEKTDVRQYTWIQLEENYALATLMEIRGSLWT